MVKVISYIPMTYDSMVQTIALTFSTYKEVIEKYDSDISSNIKHLNVKGKKYYKSNKDIIEIYKSPSTSFVKDFITNDNITKSAKINLVNRIFKFILGLEYLGGDDIPFALNDIDNRIEYVIDFNEDDVIQTIDRLNFMKSKIETIPLITNYLTISNEKVKCM